MSTSLFPYRVAILGCPSYPQVEWNEANLERLRSLGFNTIQLNIAWASRPADEPLNLEDVVELPADRRDALAGRTSLQSDPSPEARQRRRDDLRARIDLAKAAGFRTIFHFGAPYVGDRNIGDALANCLLDGTTVERCVSLLETLAAEFPGIDDILIYTYDQHAWLCSEFGPCPRCTGRPLDERVVPFLSRMAETWTRTHPDGRLWWEPWELSAGQVFRCIEALPTEGIGLALHSNIAEVMATHPVDRWLKNACSLAGQRGIPVIVEHWLGAPTEEVEPFLHLACPLVTLRGLRTIAGLSPVAGIKEYYGLVPDKEDPNLRMTGLFLADPDIEENEALRRLAEPYGEAAADTEAFWRLSSEAFELFPWDATWRFRCFGRKSEKHDLRAAEVPGIPWHTPSWESTRRALYMKVGHEEVDPWLLEDLQIRFEFAADRMERALRTGRQATRRTPQPLLPALEANLAELERWLRLTRAHAYHYRETNLATTLRACRDAGLPFPEQTVRELEDVLLRDAENQGGSEELQRAVAALRDDPGAFIDGYFLAARTEKPEQAASTS